MVARNLECVEMDSVGMSKIFFTFSDHGLEGLLGFIAAKQ